VVVVASSAEDPATTRLTLGLEEALIGHSMNVFFDSSGGTYAVPIISSLSLVSFGSPRDTGDWGFVPATKIRWTEVEDVLLAQNDV